MENLIYLVVIVIALVVLVRFLLLFSGVIGGSSKEIQLPYEKKRYFLTKGEIAFYGPLEQAVRGEYAIIPQVRLIDLFLVKGAGREYKSYRSRIDRKSVDFVLLEKTGFIPVLAIELDDNSHNTDKRRKRDEFVERVFEKTGLPLLRVKVSGTYTVEQLRSEIHNAIKAEGRIGQQEGEELQSNEKKCPQCGGILVLRNGGRGQFYGCSNYPKCRYTRN